MPSRWMNRYTVSQKRYVAILPLLLISCVFPAGCGGESAPPGRPGFAIAEGDVWLDEEPLDRARITFIPKNESSRKRKEDWLLATVLDGHFRIEVPPGNYTVRIQKYEQDGYDLKPTLPDRYDSETTLSATITEDLSEPLSFKLTSSP